MSGYSVRQLITAVAAADEGMHRGLALALAEGHCRRNSLTRTSEPKVQIAKSNVTESDGSHSDGQVFVVTFEAEPA